MNKYYEPTALQVIEAQQWFPGNGCPGVRDDHQPDAPHKKLCGCILVGFRGGKPHVHPTRLGQGVFLEPGDWVIRGDCFRDGDCYEAMKPEEFAARYRPVQTGFHPAPWAVRYNRPMLEWDPKSRPYIVDAEGNTVLETAQTVNHPGAYDRVADETAHRIVWAVNQELQLLEGYLQAQGQAAGRDFSGRLTPEQVEVLKDQVRAEAASAGIALLDFVAQELAPQQDKQGPEHKHD